MSDEQERPADKPEDQPSGFPPAPWETPDLWRLIGDHRMLRAHGMLLLPGNPHSIK